MTRRIRIEMTWTIVLVPGLPSAPFSKIEDFEAHAHGHLVERFVSYHADLSFEVVEDFESLATIRLVWSVDLDMVPGAWHEPSDHQQHARNALIDGISAFGRRLEIVSTTAMVDPDHAEVA